MKRIAKLRDWDITATTLVAGKPFVLTACRVAGRFSMSVARRSDGKYDWDYQRSAGSGAMGTEPTAYRAMQAIERYRRKYR